MTPAGPRVLDQRDIRVVETRSDDDVAPQIAEMIGGHEHRRIEPSVHRADDPDRSGDIGTHGVRHAVQTAVAGHDVHGIAALRLNDRGNLPSARQDVPRERQGVASRSGRTGGGRRNPTSRTGWECRNCSGRRSPEELSELVSSDFDQVYEAVELQTARQPFGDGHPGGVVAGEPAALDLGDVAERQCQARIGLEAASAAKGRTPSTG